MDCSGRPLQEWFPYATLLGSTVDTCLASVYEAFWKNFTISTCSTLGDDFMLSPYSALSLVRQRIHAVYGALKVHHIQRYA